MIARITLLLLCLLPCGALGASAGNAEHGRVVFALAGGCSCHTPSQGPVGAGGREIVTPFGKFYGTNITPDAETGIGAWTDAEVVAAIRDGYARGKGVEAPVMPYPQYSGMADRDVEDLVAYLRTLPPVRRRNRDHELSLPWPRLAFRLWRLLFGPAAGAVPAEAPAAGAPRGRYLVDHVSICADCHTPRNRFGVLVEGMYLAGTENGPNGKSVPNITPDRATGIGDWDASDVVQVLESGMLPNFDNVQGLMAEVVDGAAGGPGYAKAPKTELRAIAEFLGTVKPVEHDVSGD